MGTVAAAIPGMPGMTTDNTRLAKVQGEWARYLRSPKTEGLPAGTGERRMGAYAELLRSNIGGFVHQCFPICRKWLPKERWDALVDRFFAEGVWHNSPFFHEIPKAFVSFLEESAPAMDLPPWYAALAHYEWLELAVETAPDVPPRFGPQGLALSPGCQLEASEWPVHTISPDSTDVAEAATFIMVFRNRQNKVRFSVLAPAAAQLLYLLQENGCDRDAAEVQLAEQWQMDIADLRQQTNPLVEQWLADELLLKQSKLSP